MVAATVVVSVSDVVHADGARIDPRRRDQAQSQQSDYCAPPTHDALPLSPVSVAETATGSGFRALLETPECDEPTSFNVLRPVVSFAALPGEALTALPPGPLTEKPA